MLLTFLIRNAYKRVLCSLLTSGSIPVVQDDLQEVIKSKYLVITASALDEFKENQRIAESAAKVYVLMIVEAVEEGKNISHVNWYRQLNTTMVFMYPAYASELFVSPMTKRELQSEKGNFSIPQKVILINPEKQVRVFAELNTIFTRNVSVLSETLDLFSTRNQWVFRRNAFLRLVSPLLAALEESGIYTKWKYFSEILSNHMHLNHARGVLN